MPAPIVLFAYNRPIHTGKTLEALATNKLADKTRLYIYCDGHKGVPDENIAAVKNLVRKVSGFLSVEIIERERNLGCGPSIIRGVTDIFRVYDRAIVLEDDLVTSRYFLQYMNDALNYYKEDPCVFSITGHSFPSKYLRIPRDYVFDTYAAFRNSSWSWATWRDRWQLIDWELRDFPEFSKNSEAQRDFNRGGDDLSGMLRDQYRGVISAWDIQACYAQHSNGMVSIYPVQTMVRNIGLDNSGTHSRPEPRYHHPRLDEAWLPVRLCPALPVDERIASSFRQIFAARPTPRYITALRSLRRRSRGFRRTLSNSIRDTVQGKSRINICKADVLVVNTFQKSEGGAARAAYRTFLGIKKVRPKAHYLNLISEDREDDISGLFRDSLEAAKARRLMALDVRPLKRYPNRQNVIFTPALRSNPLRIRLSQFKPELVHLHWVARGMLQIEELAALQVPVVWTMHDTWVFTGGCHYSGDCRRYERECGSCPQLGSIKEDDLSHQVWLRKRKAFERLNLVAVAPSHWLAGHARNSSLLKKRRVEVIPNGLDTNVFQPIAKAAARKYFGLPRNEPVLLFGAQSLSDPRKGGDLLFQALSKISFSCTLLAFGEGKLQVPSGTKLNVRSLGAFRDEISLAMVYSAADVFICPSREDNLPNTVAEALACGTPCAAFHVDGLPEMIDHTQNGWLAKPFDIEDLSRGINWIVDHPDPSGIRDRARQKALQDFCLEKMTESYERLYTELLSSHPIRVK